MKLALRLLAALTIFASAAHAAGILPTGKTQIVDASGAPCNGCSLYFYVPNTLTPKDTWQDQGQTILNTNPVVLDSLGSAIIYGTGSYREILKDANGNTLWDVLTYDPISLDASWGGISTGSGNAQVVANADFSLIDGQVINFIAGSSNTGAMTLNVNATGAITLKKDTENGPIDTVSGDVVAGNAISVVYDATAGIFHLLTATPVHQFDSAVYFDGIITPTVLSADQNDYTPPGGYSGANTVRISSTVPVNITGLTGGADGRTVFFHNVGANPITFVAGSASSVAANRFSAPGPIQLLPNADVSFQYDGLSTAWRQITRTSATPQFQVQLTRVNSTAIQLCPYNGSYLFIGGANQIVPSACVTASNGALSSGTLYYVYAYMNSGNMALDLSVTSYAKDPVYGEVTKSGDTSRTLVGMIRTDGSDNFQDNGVQRFVRSYFNDRGYSLLNWFTTAHSTSSSSYVEINSEIRVEFIAWADEIVHLSIAGAVSPPASTANTAIGIDGTSPEDGYSAAGNGTGVTVVFPISVNVNKIGLSEGYHYATLLGDNSGSSGTTWFGSSSAGSRTVITGYLHR